MTTYNPEQDQEHLLKLARESEMQTPIQETKEWQAKCLRNGRLDWHVWAYHKNLFKEGTDRVYGRAR